MSVFKKLLLAPILTIRWLRYAPRGIQILVLLSGVGIAAGGVYYFAVRLPAHNKMLAAVKAWKHFEEATLTLDVPEMKVALDEVLAVKPEETLAASRKEALETLSASASDAPMTFITLQLNLRAGKLDAADREADKRLSVQPYDWISRCTRAYVSLSRGDREGAKKLLQGLPPPDNPNARLDAGGLLFAIGLYRQTGLELDPLFGFIRVNVLPNLTSPTVMSLPASIKVQMLECYLELFDGGPIKANLEGLSTSWTGVGSLADRAVGDAKDAGDAPVLISLGRISLRLVNALNALRRESQITPEQYPELLAEVRNRGKIAWQAALERDPKNPEPYHGLALLTWQTGDYKAARELIVKGLAEAKESPALYALFATMMQIEEKPEVAAQAIFQAAERNADKPIWWVIAAEAAAAARRRDLAIQACQRGRKADPKNTTIIRLEAKLWLESGDFHRAVQLLQLLGEKSLISDPQSAMLYTRSLLGAGLGILIEDYFTKMEQNARDTENPLVAAAAIRGLIQPPYSIEHLTFASEQSDRLLTRWRDNPELTRVRAEAIARAAEFATPLWDVTRLRIGIAATEQARALFPDDGDLAAQLAWMRLKGDKNAVEALRDVATLIRNEASQPLPVPQLEVLGAVYLANDKLDDALRVLLKAQATGRATSRGLTHLALTYLALKKKAEAEVALTTAAPMPRTGQDSPDYLTAVRIIKETP